MIFKNYILYIFIFLTSWTTWSSQSLPYPKTLYHYGKKEYLIEDARIDTIPNEVWSKYFIGPESQSNHMPWRRGLYTCTSFCYGRPYGTLSNTNQPWFMSIHLKDSCMNSDSYIIPSELKKNALFLEWEKQNLEKFLEKNKIKKEEFEQNCLKFDSSLNMYRFFLKQSINNGETYCERYIDQFLNDRNIKIVKDESVPHAWYIRDLNCIDEIKGEAAEMVQMITDFDESFWKSECDSEFRSNDYRTPINASSFWILIEAIRESLEQTPPTSAQLQKIQTAISKSTFPLDSSKENAQNFWLRENGRQVIHFIDQCITQSKTALLMQNLTVFTTETAQEKFGSIKPPQGKDYSDYFLDQLKNLESRLATQCR